MKKLFLFILVVIAILGFSYFALADPTPTNPYGRCVGVGQCSQVNACGVGNCNTGADCGSSWFPVQGTGTPCVTGAGVGVCNPACAGNQVCCNPGDPGCTENTCYTPQALRVSTNSFKSCSSPGVCSEINACGYGNCNDNSDCTFTTGIPGKGQIGTPCTIGVGVCNPACTGNQVCCNPGDFNCVPNTCYTPPSGGCNPPCAANQTCCLNCTPKSCYTPGPLSSGFTNNNSFSLPNPLCPTGSQGTGTCIDSFPVLIATITNYVFDLIAGLAVLMFLWAGILFVTSAGNEGRLGSARKALWWAIIGIAIALAGKGLIRVISAVIGNPT